MANIAYQGVKAATKTSTAALKSGFAPIPASSGKSAGSSGATADASLYTTTIPKASVRIGGYWLSVYIYDDTQNRVVERCLDHSVKQGGGAMHRLQLGEKIGRADGMLFTFVGDSVSVTAPAHVWTRRGVSLESINARPIARDAALSLHAKLALGDKPVKLSKPKAAKASAGLVKADTVSDPVPMTPDTAISDPASSLE